MAENRKSVAERQLDAVAFVGDTLGQLFLNDPQNGSAAPLFDPFGSLDVDAAAAEWPFVDPDVAKDPLALMASGLENGVSSDLTWEYRRLFVGPQTKAAPPWGSVYTDHDRVTFGASERELRRWMREQGIALAANESEPADHFGLLLRMMAWIAIHKPDALADYLRLHLLTWSGHFLDIVEHESRHRFYTGLARLARETLEGVRAEFEIEVDYPRYFK